MTENPTGHVSESLSGEDAVWSEAIRRIQMVCMQCQMHWLTEQQRRDFGPDITSEVVRDLLRSRAIDLARSDSFVRTLFRRRFIDRLRRSITAKRGAEVLATLKQSESLEQPISQALEQQELVHQLEAVVSRLSNEDRLLVQLGLIEELPVRQISTVVGVSHATVARRLSELRTRLAKSLRRAKQD